MRYAYNDEQRAVAESARALFKQSWSKAVLRKTAAQESGFPSSVWQQLVECGLLGISIPEKDGGGGGSLIDLAPFIEEAGRSLLSGPWLEGPAASIALAEQSGVARDRVRSALTTGPEIVTVAIALDLGGDCQGRLLMKPTSDGVRVAGEVSMVPWVACADRAVVSGQLQGAPALALVDLSVGTSSTSVPALDPRDRLYDVRFDGDVSAGLVLARGDQARRCAESYIRVATVLKCLEMLGGARAVLALAVDHACTRQQFGRAIGGFQAIKHRLADAAIDTENIAAVTYAALWSVATGENAAESIAVAKAYASEAYLRVCQSALQVHGGIGFTWEADVHLYLKHAVRCGSTYGSADAHLRRLSQLLLDREAAALANHTQGGA